MRRLLTVVTTTALSIGLLVASANAASSPIVSYKGLPADWAAFSVPCSSGSLATYSPEHVTGPLGAPAGHGSLRLSGSPTSSPLVFFGPENSPLLSTLTAFDEYVYWPSTGGVIPGFDIEVSDGSTDYSLHAMASGSGWIHLDATGTNVLSYDSFNNQTNTEGQSGTTTLSEFVTEHPQSTFNTFILSPTKCGPTTYYLDDVHYAVGTTDNTINFEAPLQAVLGNSSHPSSVLSGTVVNLRSNLTSAGTALGGQTVSLYARGAGNATYRLVKSLTTDASGAVSLRVPISRTTTYQWRYSGVGTNYASASAPAFTVTSRQRVVATSKLTSTSYRGIGVFQGRVTPDKAGVTVRLIRMVSGKRVVVASARTTAGGNFTIKTLMTRRGTYTYLVTALPYAGEALGKSGPFKLRTR